MKQNKKNYGIAILRVILSFMVVLDHFYNYKVLKNYLNILYYHIPTFFVLSFYYTSNYFITFNISKIKSRFERIVIPLICWSIIALIINNIYYYYLSVKCPHTIFELFHNLLNGHLFYSALWFQIVLILSTLIVSIVVLSFKTHYLLIFQFLLNLAYKFQYSGENYKFFCKNFTIHYTITYGRFIDVFPHVITGLLLGIYNIPNNLKIHRIKTIFINIIILIFLSKYNFDVNMKCFKYGGIRLDIASICIFLIFDLSNIKIKNEKAIKILDFITNYTPGIYFSHYLIGKGIMKRYILGNKINTLFGCIIIYLTSYALCFSLDKLIGNTKLKHIIK